MSGAVCRYYLNNNCRYGDRCRFSHDLTNSNVPAASKNPYVYVRDQNDFDSDGKKNYTNADVQELIETIMGDAKQVEYDKMWPLTCLSVLKDSPTVPGWDDYSMEELRAAAYSAKAAGRFDDYVKFYHSLKQKAKSNRAIFMRAGKRAEEIVRGMFEKSCQSSSAMPTSSIPSLLSLPFNSSDHQFGSSVPAATTNAPLFASSAALGSGQAFASSGTSTGIFAEAGRDFNQRGTSRSQSSEMSNDTAMETVFDIGVNQAQSTAFQQNTFGQVPQQNPFISSFTPASSAGTGASVFGAASQSAQNSSQLNVIFTPINELTPLELEQFKATTFSLDALPLRPPPQELC